MNYDIVVCRKQIKNIYLRIQHPNRIVVSCSPRVSAKRIQELIAEKQPWIDRKIAELNESYHNETIRTGAVLSLAEQRYSIVLIHGKKNTLSVEEDRIILTVTDCANETLKRDMLLKWYRKSFQAYAQQRTQELYTANSHLLSHLPKKIAVRDMDTRWGSFSRKTDTIALALRLGAYSKKAIDSVICHELAHTVHMNHQSAFYSVLHAILPDCRQISKELKQKKPAENWFLSE